MYILPDICFICLTKKPELNYLFDLDNSGINFHDKLTSAFTDMCFKELDKKTKICIQCCNILDIVYLFWQRCVKSTTILREHIVQLTLDDEPIEISHYQPNIDLFVEKTASLVQTFEVPPLAPIAPKKPKTDAKTIPPLTILQNANIPPLANIAQRLKEQQMQQAASKSTKGSDIAQNNNQIAQKPTESSHMPPLTIKICESSKTISTKSPAISTKVPNILKPTKPAITKPPAIDNGEYQMVIAYTQDENKSDIAGNKLLLQIEEVDIKPDQTSIELMNENDEDTVVEIDAEKLYYIVEERGNVVYLKSEDELKNGEKTSPKRKLPTNYNPRRPKRRKKPAPNGPNPLVCAPNRERGVYECIICGEQLKGKGNLLRHIENHGESVHECRICVEHFLDENSYKEHMKIHTNTKSYECDICDQLFLDIKDYNEHVSVHADEESLYECKICQARFKQRAAVDRHVKKHEEMSNEEKLYECNICKEMYNHRDAFDIHMDLHWRKVI